MIDVAFIINQTAVGVVIAAVVWLFRQTSQNQKDINEAHRKIREDRKARGVKVDSEPNGRGQQ